MSYKDSKELIKLIKLSLFSSNEINKFFSLSGIKASSPLILKIWIFPFLFILKK